MSVPACDLWWASTASLRRGHLALLSDVELRRVARYHHAADRERCALGAVLLRLVTARELGTAPAGVVVDRTCPGCGDQHGRPELPGSGLAVSVTHSGGVVGVAVTRAGPVGVDVEEFPERDIGRLRTAVLAPDEAASVRGPEEFARCWARKEAVLKATGDGITADPRSVDLGPADGPPRLRGYPGRAPGPVFVADASPAEGYAGAVCLLGRGPVTINHHTADALLSAA